MKLSRDKINHISSLIIKDFAKREDLDYKVDPNELRLVIVKAISDELTVDDQADAEARKILNSYTSKPLREGTPEWEVLYHKHYTECLKKHGL